MAEVVVKIPEELEKVIEELQEEDWSEVALKAIEFPIWSNEKAFKKQSKVKVFSTNLFLERKALPKEQR